MTEINSDKRLHRELMTTRTSDLDDLHHVNNSIYSNFFEQSRRHWLYAIYEKPQVLSRNFVVLKTLNITFIKELKHPSNIMIDLFVKKIGNSSLSLYQEIRNADDTQILYTQGESILIWVHPESRQPVTIPDDFRAEI